MIEARAPGGRDTGARTGEGQAWVTFDAAGTPQVVTARDRQSDLFLRYLRAMDGYARPRVSPVT